MYQDIDAPELIPGIKYWQNKNNRFNVLAVHYTADPDKQIGSDWYINERAGTPKATWNKEYEMDDSTKSGALIFGKEFCDLDPSIHFINSYEFGGDVEYLFGLDFGQRNPTCGLLAIWDGNAITFVDEYYKPGLPSVTSREMIYHFKPYLFPGLTDDDLRLLSYSKKRSKIDSIISTKVIDPSTTSKNRIKRVDGEDIEYSVIEEFYDNGWDFEPGNNDVAAGINRMRELMMVDDFSKTRFYVFKDRCPNLCRELLGYRYKEYSEIQDKSHNKSEEPVKKDDHSVDCARYIVMTRQYPILEKPKQLTRIQRDIEELTKPKIFNFEQD